LSKQNKDFLKDSFYKHSETRAKKTDEMEQTCMLELIEYLVKSRLKRKDDLQFMGIKRENNEYNDGDSSR
jgi:hypothetical protein